MRCFCPKAFLLAVVVFWCSPAFSSTESLAPGARKTPDAIPIEKGYGWVYSGQIEWQSVDGKEHRKVLKWRTEVQDVRRVGDLTVAVLKGHPIDLAFFEEGRQPGRHLLVKDGAGKYYLLSNNRAETYLTALDNGLPPLPLLGEELVLDGGRPVSAALRSAEDNGFLRWVFDGEREYSLKRVKGLSGSKTLCWRMTYRDNTCHMMSTYVPGVGLVAYSFRHHGTLSRVDVELSEFIHPEPGRSSDPDKP